MPFDFDVRDGAYIGRSYLNGFAVAYTQILWEVANVYTAKWLQEILMVERRIQVAAFQIQVSFLVGLDKVQIDSLLQDLFIGLRTCLRRKSIMFYLIEKDTGVVFKDHSCSKKSCFLVVVGSIEVVRLVSYVSTMKLLMHLRDIIDVEPTSCEASTWIDKAVSQRLLDSNSISTTFSCWSDVTCASRKLLTCGKLSLVVPCFSTNVRFLVGKETNALVVALMWKLHALSLDINSSSHTLPTITHGVFKKIWHCLLGDNLKCGEAKCWQVESSNTYTSLSSYSLVFRPFQVISGLVLRDILDFRYETHWRGEDVSFTIKFQVVHQQARPNLELSAQKYKESIIKGFDVAFDPGDFVHTSCNQTCLPLHRSSNSENDPDVILKAEFKSLYKRWKKVSQENLDLIKDKVMMESKMQHIKEKLAYEEKQLKRLKIKLAATQECFCAMKNEDHDVVTIKRLHAELVREKETSERLEKELMEYKKNVRMLNSGTKNLDQILSMGRTGKARFGLGYRGGTSMSKTVFVPEICSKYTGTREQPDSRTNPFLPGGTDAAHLCDDHTVDGLRCDRASLLFLV